MSAPV
jgi:hypothetical protein